MWTREFPSDDSPGDRVAKVTPDRAVTEFTTPVRMSAPMRRVASDRLAMTADEIRAGHCVALSCPEELADMLVGYATSPGR